MVTNGKERLERPSHIKNQKERKRGWGTTRCAKERWFGGPPERCLRPRAEPGGGAGGVWLCKRTLGSSRYFEILATKGGQQKYYDTTKAANMAGASDKARFYLEQSIPELQELERKKIFTIVRAFYCPCICLDTDLRCAGRDSHHLTKEIRV